ncbi:MAG: ABC transporter permease [Bacillota bacterium]
MNDTVIGLSVLDIALGYVFVLVVLYILKRQSIKRESILILATVRMTVQLVAMGFILTVVLENPHPLITFSIILVMITFAVFTVFRKFKGRLTPSLKRVIMIAIPVGTLVALSYFLFVVVRITPYYDPQYFIPISGMIIGNSMTGISLGVHTMIHRFTDNRMEVVEALNLGAHPKDASRPIINEAFDSAIMPTLNNMLGIGIIFLPGMMTGQILSGVVPMTAISYQIGIMLGILGGVSLTTYIFLRLAYRTFFNDQQQLVVEE